MSFDSTSSVVQWPHPKPATAEAALLDLLGPVDGLHVLVIGPGSLGPILALHGRGAASVTAIRAGSRVRPQAADAALVLGLTDAAMADSVIACAQRAIRPLNGLVVQFAPDAPSSLLQHTRQRLAEAGFSIGRAVAAGGTTAIVADLPLYGRLKCA